jgi:hypothetical protein
MGLTIDEIKKEVESYGAWVTNKSFTDNQQFDKNLGGTVELASMTGVVNKENDISFLHKLERIMVLVGANKFKYTGGVDYNFRIDFYYKMTDEEIKEEKRKFYLRELEKLN